MKDTAKKKRLSSRRIQERINDHGEILDMLNLDQKQRVLFNDMPQVLDYIKDLHDQVITLKSLKVAVKVKPKRKREMPCVMQIDPKTNEVIATYRNQVHAAESMGVSRWAIRVALDNESLEAGYAWKRLYDWLICKTCGFEGQRSKHFAKNDKNLYKSECIKCANKSAEKYKNIRAIKELQDGKNGKN